MAEGKSDTISTLSALNDRSREVFRCIVDAYFETGEPVGSRTLSRLAGMSVSPATIRNVMADLEDMGLLFSPHTSAGRLPTEIGLRLFVDGLLEVGALSSDERESIEAQCAAAGRSLPRVLEDASGALSGLTHCAGLVLAPKTDRPLKHIEFVSLAPGRALVVMVTEDGMVENRLIELPLGLPPSALTQATNYLNAHILGRTVEEVRAAVDTELAAQKAELDALAKQVVDAGLASWSGENADGGSLIVRGQANLLDNVTVLTDLERVRGLFAALETKESAMRLLEALGGAEGVQIYIGAESELFGLSGCSMVIAPYGQQNGRVIGAIGVIGPTRINYARVIPMVDYTAKVIGRMIGQPPGSTRIRAV